MKKLLFLFPIMILSLLMSSCKGDEGPMGRPGLDGLPGESGYFYSDYKEVFADDWEVFGDDNDEGTYIEYSFAVPQLDKVLFDKGIVNAFVEKDDKKYQLSDKVPLYKENEDLDFFIKYTYFYEIGRIYFRISYSDNLVRFPDREIFYFVLQAEK